METTGASHFEFDWWIIQKRAVYVGVFILLAAVVAGGAALYVWKFGNPLKSVVAKSDVPAGARFMAFEGDVRVIRSAT